MILSRRAIGVAVAAVVALAGPWLADAQQSMNMPGMKMEETESAAPFHPGLGDLMTAFVQPRHIKLGLAGATGNWTYAAYELGELREAFDDVGKLVPKHGNLAIPPAIAATVTPPMAALDKAIKDKDAPGFTTAYGLLTMGCNACHQSAGHPMIVIRVPAASPYPDQDFQPPK